jgi:hypothetical protein
MSAYLVTTVTNGIKFITFAPYGYEKSERYNVRAVVITGQNTYGYTYREVTE